MIPSPAVVSAGLAAAGATARDVFLIIDDTGDSWIWDPIGTDWQGLISDRLWSFDRVSRFTPFVDAYQAGACAALSPPANPTKPVDEKLGRTRWISRSVYIPALEVDDQTGTIRIECDPLTGMAVVSDVGLLKGRAFGSAVWDAIAGSFWGGVKGFCAGGPVGAIISGIAGGISGGLNGMSEETLEALGNLGDALLSEFGPGDQVAGQGAKVDRSKFASALNLRNVVDSVAIAKPGTDPSRTIKPGQYTFKLPEASSGLSLFTIALIGAAAYLLLSKGK